MTSKKATSKSQDNIESASAFTQNMETVKHPVSDDTLDYLETQVDKFNETSNLGEKIDLHSKLKESICYLEKEVDLMVEIIDTIDTDYVSSEIKVSTDTMDRTEINDDIVNIEKMIEGMNDEDVMQIKLKHIKKITDTIKLCKEKCNLSKMRILKCN